LPVRGEVGEPPSCRHAPAPRPPTEGDIISRVFRHALCREPTDAERKKMTALLKDAGATPAARREAVEDLFWAVLTSREFLFNH
jgi:hypothetical protein